MKPERQLVMEERRVGEFTEYVINLKGLDTMVVVFMEKGLEDNGFYWKENKDGKAIFSNDPQYKREY